MDSFFDSANSSVYANKFSTSSVATYRYLGLRDLPELIKKYSGDGNRGLDYGCGPGISTKFLKNHGLQADGVDISSDMIEKAAERDPEGNYRLIKSGEVPVVDGYYDFVQSSYVLMYVSTKAELVNIFKEVKRILKPDGCFVALICNEGTYTRNWIDLEAKFEENKTLRSGVPVKLLLKDINLLMHQYFWTENDFQEVCDQVGLTIVYKHCPLGYDGEGFEWVYEKYVSPFDILVMKKSKSNGAHKQSNTCVAQSNKSNQ